MIPVFHGGHLFSCPLRTLVVVVIYTRIHVFFKFFECFTSGCIDLVFQMSKEWFGRSVVEAISFSRHGLDTAHIQELSRVGWMGIMESLIGLDICSFELIVCILGFEFLECLLYHIQVKTKGDIPRKYFSTRHILDYGKIAPLILVGDVRDIGSKFPVWYISTEFTIQYIRCCL